MLGDAVGSGSNLGKQSGSRDGLQKVTFASSEHRGKNCSRGVHMRHDIDAPTLFPIRVRSLHSAVDTHARIRTKQIDDTELTEGCLDDVLHVGFMRNVRFESQTADFASEFPGAGSIQVDDCHGSSAGFGETSAQSPPDAVSAACDDYGFARDLHDPCSIHTL
jgi:hypothetical protein